MSIRPQSYRRGPTWLPPLEVPAVRTDWLYVGAAPDPLLRVEDWLGQLTGPLLTCPGGYRNDLPEGCAGGVGGARASVPTAGAPLPARGRAPSPRFSRGSHCVGVADDISARLQWFSL